MRHILNSRSQSDTSRSQSAGRFLLAWLTFLVAAGFATGSANPQSGDLNQLTAEEKSAGWILLFDGKSTASWRGFRSPTRYEGWHVDDDALHLRVPGGYRGGHDLISEKAYGDFDLQWDWKLAPMANSGLKYFVSL